MKKITVLFLALVMILGSMPTGLITASAADLALGDYTFVDIAHHGDTYVALAKDAAFTAARFYYSKDGGLTWEKAARNISNATVYSNKESRQQLAYWPEQNAFIVHCGGTDVVSKDGGVTWDTCDNTHTAYSEIITVSGGQFISALSNGITATNTISEKLVTANKYGIADSSDPEAIAAKPADAEGNIDILLHNRNILYDVRLSVKDGRYTWSANNRRYNGSIPGMPYDMVYAKAADQFLSVNNLGSLYVVNGSGGTNGFSGAAVELKISKDVKVTGIGVNDQYIFVGMENGKLYYTANAAGGITSETVWTEIPVKSGCTPSAEAIKNIEVSEDNSFVALGSTQIFKGSLEGYTNINEYKSVGNQFVTGLANNDMFKGVRLIGGAYSPSLGKYIVYGDTATKGQDDRYWGKIFESTDGINWTNSYTGYTFSYRKTDETDTSIITGYEEAKNGAVWWDAQNQFIVSASTRDHEKAALVSSVNEGELTWSGTTAVDLKMHNDMAIAGDTKLYTLYGRNLWKYTEWSADGQTNKETVTLLTAGGKNVPAWYMNRLAVSDDAEPAVLMAQNSGGVVRNNTSVSATETDNWTLITNLGGAVLTDAIYSKSLESFVGVLTTENKVSIIGKTGTVTKGPSVGTVFNAVDTNDTDFMFAGADGKVYTASDRADFASARLTAVPAAAGSTENQMNVTNVFKAGTDTFIATVTDNTNSDVLLIKKNGANWSYTSTADSQSLEDGLVAGSTVTVGAEGVNNTAEDYHVTMVAAVYAEDDTLLQVKSAEQTIAAGTSARFTMPMTLNADLPANTSIKVFLWDMETMSPAAIAATNPF